MISYRSIKRLLGETSLERKCRFLFGAGLLLLISSSFWIYARMTRHLVYEEKEAIASNMVPLAFNIEHLVWDFGTRDQQSADEPTAEAARPSQEEVAAEVFRAYQAIRADRRGIRGWSIGPAIGEEAREAFEQLRQSGDPYVARVGVDEDGTKVLAYYELLRADSTCLECHNKVRLRQTEATGEHTPPLKAGDVMGLARISLNLDQTEVALGRNSLLLMALASLTAFLAMLAAYLIVRYVIVKPVLHLKDVSDEISRGNLELRADINTGDEFEQLSHAFNRMLRHMMTVNDELRTLNADLDAKFDQLAQVNLRLYETSKMKDEFLATMSHELRTPLNSILGFSEVLQNSPSLTDKERHYVRNIQTSGQSLLALINDLLDLAKIESGKMDIQPTEFSLEELIGRQVSNIHPLAEKKHIELRWDVAPGTQPLLQDQGKLSQILNNLLSNAIKFTPEGGRVRVSGRQVDRNTVEIQVEDTGIGIPLDEQDKVFEKFRQGTTTPGERDHVTREYEGTGLGLSIVRELTQLLGGEVSLVSEFGKGSTFTVRVPVEVKVEVPEPVDLDADADVDSRSMSMSSFGRRLGKRDPAADDQGR